LETGFIYIKVVVVTTEESCGKEVKPQVRAYIQLCKGVEKVPKAVGKKRKNR